MVSKFGPLAKQAPFTESGVITVGFEENDVRSTGKTLTSIFGANDGRRLVAVGTAGTILRSTDGVNWELIANPTKYTLTSVFATSDGKRMWAVGEGGTILESSGR